MSSKNKKTTSKISLINKLISLDSSLIETDLKKYTISQLNTMLSDKEAIAEANAKLFSANSLISEMQGEIKKSKNQKQIVINRVRANDVRAKNLIDYLLDTSITKKSTNCKQFVEIDALTFCYLMNKNYIGSKPFYYRGQCPVSRDENGNFVINREGSNDGILNSFGAFRFNDFGASQQLGFEFAINGMYVKMNVPTYRYNAGIDKHGNPIIKSSCAMLGGDQAKCNGFDEMGLDISVHVRPINKTLYSKAIQSKYNKMNSEQEAIVRNRLFVDPHNTISLKYENGDIIQRELKFSENIAYNVALSQLQ